MVWLTTGLTKGSRWPVAVIDFLTGALEAVVAPLSAATLGLPWLAFFCANIFTLEEWPSLGAECVLWPGAAGAVVRPAGLPVAEGAGAVAGCAPALAVLPKA